MFKNYFSNSDNADKSNAEPPRSPSGYPLNIIFQIVIMLTNPPRSLSEDPLNIIFQIVIQETEFIALE